MDLKHLTKKPKHRKSTSTFTQYATQDNQSLRFKVVTILFILVSLAIVSRLFYWQILAADELIAAADAQHWEDLSITIPRGKILFSDKSIMVDNRTEYAIYANKPQLETDLYALAQAVSSQTVSIPQPTPTLPPVIEEEEEATESAELSPTPTPTPTPEITIDQLRAAESQRLSKLLQKPELQWVPLARSVTQNTKDSLQQQIPKGLIFQQQTGRAYPEASQSAHLIGIVGEDEAGRPKGFFGLEGYYDLELTGKAGKKSWEADALGNPILYGQTKEVPSTPGRDLVTHIDKAIQYYIEQNLQKRLYQYGAQAGTVTIMDPKTGAILAMASFPTYTPDIYSHFKSEDFINPVIGKSYEPGSTFKVLTMAMGIDTGAITPDTICSCRGPLRIGKYTISTWDSQYHPDSTMTEVLVHSDNIGMVDVIKRMEKQQVYDYFRAFGLGEKTGIDLQEEASAPLRNPDSWQEVDTATSSFGQGIAITKLQLINAVAAIANQGWLMQPQVVDKVIDGEKELDIKPVPIRQVITPETAKQVTDMMIQSAAFGEAKFTALKGYQVAGKTGTAQIPDPELGGYKEEKTLASFIGFAPAYDPKFVMLITFTEPQSSPWGSETAAPLWYDIAHWLFMYWNIPPQIVD